MIRIYLSVSFCCAFDFGNSESKLDHVIVIQISCCLDSQFSGMVEAWASGLTWREIMMDCSMDEGDLARLLRRTIDILAQVQVYACAS